MIEDYLVRPSVTAELFIQLLIGNTLTLEITLPALLLGPSIKLS